jgi:hypothetical protein
MTPPTPTMLSANHGVWVVKASKWDVKGGVDTSVVSLDSKPGDYEPLTVEVSRAAAVPVVGWMQRGETLVPMILGDDGVAIESPASDVTARLVYGDSQSRVELVSLRLYRTEWQEALRVKILADRATDERMGL